MKYFRKLRSRQAFSMVELLAALAITGILASMIVSSVSLAGNLFRRADDTAKADSEIRIATAYVQSFIHKNDEIISDVPAISFVSASEIRATHAGTGNFESIVFLPDQHKLIRRIYSGGILQNPPGDDTVAVNIGNAQFTAITIDVSGIEYLTGIQMDISFNDGHISRSVQEQFSLRAESR